MVMVIQTALLASTLQASIAAELVAIRLTPWTFLLSLVSIYFLWLFRCAHFKCEPWFFDTTWTQCHWICYFYPAFLCPFLLGTLYRKLPKLLKKPLITLGKASYEIFLMQMAVIALLAAAFHSGKSVPQVLLAWPLSIGLGLALHRLLSRPRRNRTRPVPLPAKGA